MPELIYIEVYLEEKKLNAWSSLRGKIARAPQSMEKMFDSLSAVDAPGKVLIQLIGDEDKVTDDERIRIMDSARHNGFSVTRFETGEPIDPDVAFEKLSLPFT